MLPKTCIIVTNLDKDDFVSAPGKPMLVAETIKYGVLSECASDIEYWLALPNLSRIIIILKTESVAGQVYKSLLQWGKDKKYKFLIQENLLSRSKLWDGELSSPTHNSGPQFPEPTPKHFDAISDLEKMGIDVSVFNTDEQMSEWQHEEAGRPVGRARSVTKTLFSPIEPPASKTGKVTPPASPTITLDEFDAWCMLS